MPSTRSQTPSPVTEVETGFETEVVLTPGKVTVIVAALRLGDESNIPRPTIPSSTFLTSYLGLSKTSPLAFDLLWQDRIKLGTDNQSFLDLCTSAACLEQILSVTSIPVHMANTGPHPSRCSPIPEQPDGSHDYLLTEPKISHGMAMIRDIMGHQHVDLEHAL